MEHRDFAIIQVIAVSTVFAIGFLTLRSTQGRLTQDRNPEVISVSGQSPRRRRVEESRIQAGDVRHCHDAFDSHRARTHQQQDCQSRPAHREKSDSIAD